MQKNSPAPGVSWAKVRSQELQYHWYKYISLPSKRRSVLTNTQMMTFFYWSAKTFQFVPQLKSGPHFLCVVKMIRVLARVRFLHSWAVEILFVCLFVWIKPENLYFAPCVWREVITPGNGCTRSQALWCRN